ncbi:MAG: NAD-dependent epimerase/dehydratase family protein [Planctomycetota bacterium]
MARVLVTGASGFIGSHLVAALVARGDCVTALVRKTSCLDRLESLGVSLARGELGFSVRTPLAERLRQSAEWYRKKGWL